MTLELPVTIVVDDIQAQGYTTFFMLTQLSMKFVLLITKSQITSNCKFFHAKYD